MSHTCLTPKSSKAASEGSLLLWSVYHTIKRLDLDCPAGLGGRIGDVTSTHHLQRSAKTAMVDTFRYMYPLYQNTYVPQLGHRSQEMVP